MINIQIRIVRPALLLAAARHELRFNIREIQQKQHYKSIRVTAWQKEGTRNMKFDNFDLR